MGMFQNMKLVLVLLLNKCNIWNYQGFLYAWET